MMAVRIGDEDFERLVSEALDSVPERLMAMLDNVVVLVEAEAPADDPHLLGLYEGVPLTERGHDYVALPDTITLFRLPILRACVTDADIVREVRTTVVHEIAHHFGIDDERLGELGWA